MFKFLFFVVFLLVSSSIIGQEYNFDQSWTFLGPEEKPLQDKPQSATGIGPVEFICPNNRVEGLILASSLNGGLFYTKNGGQQWINAGSDEWPYSGCSWAAFHPKNENIWFANSCLHNDNGQPGFIGKEGGIYRTTDGGLSWALIGGSKQFSNLEFMVIYGFKFHPTDEKKLFVYTNEGLYVSDNCMSVEVNWKRVNDLGGWIYDLQFLNDKMYVTQMQFGKWRLIETQITNPQSYKSVLFVEDMPDPIESITLNQHKQNLLVLVNYTKRSDVLYTYDVTSKESTTTLKYEQVVFGKGRAFAVSPHRPDEAMIGYSVTMRRWDLTTSKEIKAKGAFHPDVEYIAYDPFDSMRVYLASHGGVYISTDHCKSWDGTSRGLGIAEVEGLSVSLEDPQQIGIGCFHDGSSVRADFEKNGLYHWKNVNGGDGLITLQPDYDPTIIYTSNQYAGGGLYISRDSGKVNSNIHNVNQLQTSGWQMAAVLHPVNQDLLFFNYQLRTDPGKGNIDVVRTNDPSSKDSLQRITNFTASHSIDNYSVYGIYNTPAHPDEMYVHIIQNTTNDKGERINIHRVFKTDNCTNTAEDVMDSWYEIEIPRSDWIGCIRTDEKKKQFTYISYVDAKPGATNEDLGMIYQLKYHKKKHYLRKETDLSGNLPNSFTGRFNLIPDGRGGFFFGTRSGIYYADKAVLKGKASWIKIGFGLPHCRVHGLHFDPNKNSLTVGYYGRGVWRYYL